MSLTMRLPSTCNEIVKKKPFPLESVQICLRTSLMVVTLPLCCSRLVSIDGIKLQFHWMGTTRNMQHPITVLIGSFRLLHECILKS